MAMTAAVKAELARIEVTKPCCRKAEAASMLRFAGGLHIVSGRIVVEADLDSGATARRLRRDIAEIYGHASEVIVLQPTGLRKRSRLVPRGGRRRDIAGISGHAGEVMGLQPTGLRKGSRFVVRVVKDGESLARQTGL